MSLSVRPDDQVNPGVGQDWYATYGLNHDVRTLDSKMPTTAKADDCPYRDRDDHQ